VVPANSERGYKNKINCVIHLQGDRMGALKKKLVSEALRKRQRVQMILVRCACKKKKKKQRRGEGKVISNLQQFTERKSKIHGLTRRCVERPSARGNAFR